VIRQRQKRPLKAIRKLPHAHSVKHITRVAPVNLKSAIRTNQRIDLNQVKTSTSGLTLRPAKTLTPKPPAMPGLLLEPAQIVKACDRTLERTHLNGRCSIEMAQQAKAKAFARNSPQALLHPPQHMTSLSLPAKRRSHQLLPRR
jgi:hypothetical protein